MSESFENKETIELTLGHLLIIWDIIANKIPDSSVGDKLLKQLSTDERRAIWVLQDICENKLAEVGLGNRPETEWNNLIEKALKHVSSLPCEFLD